MLQAALSVEIEDTAPFVLRKSEPTYFRVDRPHSYRNIANGNMRGFVVATPGAI